MIALKGLLAASFFAVVLAPLGARAAALDGRCLSRIIVDSRELRDKGGVGAANVLDAELPRELRQSFADRMGCRAGLTLLVRLQTISLPVAITGGFNSDIQDSLKGESLLVDAAGHVVASYPLTARVPSNYTGSLYDLDQPAYRLRRLNALAGAFAGWLRVYYASS